MAGAGISTGTDMSVWVAAPKAQSTADAVGSSCLNLCHDIGIILL